MSRIPKPGTKRDTSGPSRPQSAVGSRPHPSMTKSRPTSAKGDTKESKADTKETKGATKKEKKPLYPALSVPFKERPPDPVIERLKRKTIRRNAPPGEDLKKIKAVVKQLQREVVTVQEFVGLISPYTGDNGEALRKVMAEDLSSFRRMAKRVYDTMTQDVSDVLANEQIHVTEYYNERYTIYMDKMMRSIDEIYRYIPHFDFERYYKEPEEYLLELFPLRQVSVMDAEEEEMHRRQEAFHRLEWLRSEGVRLNEENAQLQQRLKELKRMQQDEMLAARQQEEMAEIRKSHLEATQAELQNHLQELNESVEQSFVAQEENLRMEQDANLEERYLERREEKKKEKSLTLPPAKGRSRTKPWNVKAAQKVEEKTQEAAVTSAASSVSVASAASKSALEKKKKARKQPKPTETSPFHFSPIKTPPDVRPPRETSPFHYSPPRPPPGMESPPAVASPPPMRRVRVEASSAAVQQEPQRYVPTGRRSYAPRDTWGGFM